MPPATTTTITTSSYTLLEPLQDGTIKSYDIAVSGLSSYISDTARYFFMLLAIVSAFYLIYGGIQYLTTDMSNLKQEGKGTIKRVIIGLVFIFSIWTIFNAINPELLKDNFVFKSIASGGGVNIAGGGATGAVPPATPLGSYPWPTGEVVGNGIKCNGGQKKRSINSSACFDNYKSFILESSSKYNVDKNIIRAVIWQESNGNANIGTSPAGAVGLMQITPPTARSIGCISGWETDPVKNIDCGTRYLRKGLNNNYTNYDLYAGYNGGYGGNSMNPSSSCSSGKRWQCAFDNSEHTVCNIGFLESRNYAIEGAVWQSTYDTKSMCSW